MTPANQPEPTGRTDWFLIISLIVIGVVIGTMLGINLQPVWVSL